MKYFHLFVLFVAAFFSSSGIAGAEPHHGRDHSHAQRTAEAHEHGTGYLNIVIEKEKMLIEVIAPGADIVGFEHAPKSASDRSAVNAAKEKFRTTGKMFTFPARAGCSAKFSEVEFEPGGQHNTKHDGSHKGHLEELDAGHGEFHAVYEIKCNDVSALNPISVGYFKLFPNAQKLVVRSVGALIQNRSVLTAKTPDIRF